MASYGVELCIIDFVPPLHPSLLQVMIIYNGTLSILYPVDYGHDYQVSVWPKTQKKLLSYESKKKRKEWDDCEVFTKLYISLN